MSDPWLKFYAAIWRADPRLRMCSLAARGLWIDLISYMHEGLPYGHLLIDGVQPDVEGISSLVGRPLAEVKKALNELETKNVFSRTESGAIYSRRMVRDKAKAEKDRDNGKGGGNPKLRSELKSPVNEGVNPLDKAKKLEVKREKLEQQQASPESGTARAKGSLAGELRTKIVEIYQAVGLEPVPDTGLADVWIAQGFNPEICSAKVREMLGRKKSLVPLSYFTNAIQEAHEKRPNGTTNGHAKISEPAKDPDEKTQHLMAEIWVSALKNRNDRWNMDTPPPGKPGCKISWDILRQHGIDPETGKRLEPAKAGTEFD